MTLRRILLETNKAFDATGSDTNDFYFCGSTTSTNGDILMGRVQSNNINGGAPSLTVHTVLQYGSPDAERTGMDSDCKLTEDNMYLVGVFSTGHQI